MWIVRPVKHEDHEALLALAASLGVGMTTFPADADTLSVKIDAAVASFDGNLTGYRAQYLMVLEDRDSGALLGVSAVYPQIGYPFGFFSYHIDRLVQYSPQIGLDLDYSILNLSNAYTGLTEIGTLAVHPCARKSGAGRILAKARYLLMACFPDLFSDRVIAEMRGWQNEDGFSPFWSAVGERFFKMDFATGDAISATKGAEWIANLMPKFPIYLDLLDEAARANVGKPHATSAIAMAMLIEEGFQFENYIDVFDAGPQMAAPLNAIRTVAESTVLPCASGSLCGEQRQFLVANQILQDFRVVWTDANPDGGRLLMDHSVIKELCCRPGSNVRFIQLNRQTTGAQDSNV
jgi:arginine N-succinyltransferase